MRNKTLIASMNIFNKGTIRGGSFISGLFIKVYLLNSLYLTSQIPL